MKATALMAMLISALAVAGCVQQTAMTKAPPSPVMSAAEARMSLVEQRKEEMLRELATCESGGHGEADKPIYGGRGAFVGRFQFMPRTVVAYVQQRDGRQLSLREATDLAHDYRQSMDLAKYMIFEQGRINDWPVCSRRLGLAQQVAQIKSAE